MKLRQCIVVISVALLPLVSIGQKPRTSTEDLTEDLIVKVLETGRVNADLTIIPPEQKDAVILRLRETAAMKGGYSLLGTVVLDVMDADLLLLRLGDTFTIERMVKDYRAYDSMASWDYATRSFRYASQPKIIPYLAEDFSSKEDPNKRITINPRPDSGDFAVGVPARSIFSGVIVTDIIKSSPLFSPQLKAWASQAFALRLEAPERFRKLMGVWWEANKAAFTRGDYLAVMPVAEQEAAPTAPTPGRVAPTAPQPVAAPPPAMPTFQAHADPAAAADGRLPMWPWIVGILALSAIAAIAVRRRA